MSKQTSFRELVKTMQDRYHDTSLLTRLKEATMSNPNLEPLAVWVRETSDLVNIVWLTDSDIKDVTWYPSDKSSSLNVIRYPGVIGYQIRETSDVGISRGLAVSGNYMVTIITSGEYGNLYWVASSRKEEEKLRNFVAEFTKKLG